MRQTHHHIPYYVYLPYAVFAVCSICPLYLQEHIICNMSSRAVPLPLYSETPHNGHPSTMAICDIMVNSPGLDHTIRVQWNPSTTATSVYSQNTISPTVAIIEGLMLSISFA